MRSRTYVIVGAIVILIVAGMIAAQHQRAKRTQELIDDLGTDSPDIAKDTLDELRKRGRGIEERLIQRTASPRRKERMRAALLLGEVGSEKCGPALIALLKDEWLPVRRAAVEALGKVGYLPAVNDLLAVVRDEEAEMDTRTLAVQSLSLLCMAGLGESERKLCVPAMAEILERRPKLTEEALETIGKRLADQAKAKAELADRESTGKPKQEKKEEQPPPAQEKAKDEELPEEPTPADKEVELRAQAVLLLGLTGAEEAFELLFDAANEEIEPAALVRQYACMAIEDLQEPPRDLSQARLMALQLKRALDDADASVRMFAARALAKHSSFGDELKIVDEAINAKLAEMAQELTDLGEPSYWVRQAARLACDARHVPYEKTRTVSDEEKSTTSLVSAGATGGN